MNIWNKSEDPIMFYKESLSNKLKSRVIEFINDDSEFVNIVDEFENAEKNGNKSTFEDFAEKWLEKSVIDFINMIQGYLAETSDETEKETYLDQIEWAKSLLRK